MNTRIFLKNNSFYIIIISVAIIIGFYFRLKGLGKWPLALDEYYIVKSAENILKYGIPEWAGGGYYLRGLLYQYSIAGLLFLGVKAEFAARIIPVFLNLLAFAPLFILSKKLSGKLFGTIVLLVFIFSVWEVEFSRFARMYVPFQTIFIWYILFLYNYIVEDKKSSLKWIFILGFTSIFVYEASIFLTLLNLLPLCWNRETRKFDLSILLRGKSQARYLVLAVLIILFAYYFNTADKRNTPGLFPPGYVNSHNHLFDGNFFHIPQILLTTLSNEPVWILLFIIVLSISLFSFYKVLRSEKRKWYNKLIIASILVTALLNLFGLLIILLIIFIMLDWLRFEDLKSKDGQWVFITLIISLTFWFIFTFFTTSWYYFFADFSPASKAAVIKKIFLLLFNYPNNYFEFYRYAITLPVFSLVFIASAALVIFKTAKSSYYESLSLRFIIFILILLILMVCLIDTILSETRYSFFLYPLVLITIYSAFKIITKTVLKEGIKEKIGFVTIGIVFFIVSGDFNAKHLTKIDSKGINFRMVYKENMIRHYYPRWDVKTPAELVNKEKQKNDVTIIDELNIEYYLDKLEYIYVNYDHLRFRMISIEGGKKERWTNSNLIYTNQQLLNLFENAKGNVWFITIHKPHLSEINFKENFKKYLYYTSIDNNIFVYKIPGGTLINKKN